MKILIWLLSVSLYKSYSMLFSEINFIILLFFLLFMSIIININTSLHLLLTAEFLWITLYSLVSILGLIFNNTNFLSLTFFFLILSAIEFSLGLVVILFQYIFNRSINLNDFSTNSHKFLNRFILKLNTTFYRFIYFVFSL